MEFCKLLCCILCIRNQQNALYSTGVFLLRYFHIHVSAGNPSISSVTVLIQEYIVVRCVKLLQIAEIHTIIGYKCQKVKLCKFGVLYTITKCVGISPVIKIIFIYVEFCLYIIKY